MTDDKELIARLRSMHWCVTTKANGVGVSDEAVAPEAADRIEELLAEQKKDHANINLKADFIDKTINQLAEAEAKLAKAVEALENVHRFGVITHPAIATLAEIKSGVATTPYGLEGESHDPL